MQYGIGTECIAGVVLPRSVENTTSKGDHKGDAIVLMIYEISNFCRIDMGAKMRVSQGEPNVE